MQKTKMAIGAAAGILGLALAASVALAQDSSTAATMPRQSLNVTASGNVKAVGTVSSFSASSVTLSVWGVTITANIGSDTNVVRRFGGKVANIMSEVQNGDTVEITGTIPSGGSLMAVNAKMVKDDSIQMKSAYFSGTVSNVSGTGFTLTISAGKTYTVTASTDTKVTLNGKSASLTDIRNGYMASVSGVWDRNQSTVSATKISARTPGTSTGGRTATSTSH